jgi:hypothetical protein
MPFSLIALGVLIGARGSHHDSSTSRALTDRSPEVIAQLKQMGFEVVLDPKTAKMIIGRLPIEKLAALAELKSVRYVAPMTSN